MVIASKIKNHTSSFHFETLPKVTLEALQKCAGISFFSRSKWYLAGGTALALQVGNRKSVDLDFFTEEKNFNEKQLLAHFADNKNWQTDVEDKNTIYGQLLKSKISFIAYPFFVPQQEWLW